MDLGVRLESPQGSKSSSNAACTCAFLQSCSSSVTLPIAWIKGSVAFPPSLPTGLSHRSVPRATVVGVDPRRESRCRAGKTGCSGWTETSGGLWNGGTSVEILSPFPWRAPPLRCDGNAGNSFPTKQRKDPSSRATRRKGGSSGCGRDPLASSRVETGMSGNFFSCSKGVKDPLEVPEVRCDYPPDASVEMGLI